MWYYNLVIAIATLVDGSYNSRENLKVVKRDSDMPGAIPCNPKGKKIHSRHKPLMSVCEVQVGVQACIFKKLSSTASSDMSQTQDVEMKK